MSRYVDADALKEWIDEYVSVFKKSDTREIKGYIEHQPTIDAVSVVRCKECTYWNSKDCRDGCGECEWAYYMTKPNDFCSYGEREGE